MFETTAQFHLYSTSPVPLWLAGFGVVLCLSAGVLAAVQAERGPKPWLLPLALTPVLVLVLAFLGLVPLLAGAEVGKVEALQGAGPYPWWAFRRLILVEFITWLAALSATGMGVAVRCFLGGAWRRLEHLAPAGVAALGLLLALAGPIHASTLLAWGPLPTLDVQQDARVHTGHQLDLDPRVVGTPHPEHCEPQPLVFAPTEPGEVTLSARAHCGLFGVERSVTASAGEDLGTPDFPMAPGHRWTWRHIREWHNQTLWFFADKGRSEGPNLHLEVVGGDTAGPLTQWTLREWVEDEPGEGAADATEHRLYRWNGRLLTMVDGVPTDQPFYERVEREAVEGQPPPRGPGRPPVSDRDLPPLHLPLPARARGSGWPAGPLRVRARPQRGGRSARHRQRPAGRHDRGPGDRGSGPEPPLGAGELRPGLTGISALDLARPASAGRWSRLQHRSQSMCYTRNPSSHRKQAWTRKSSSGSAPAR